MLPPKFRSADVQTLPSCSFNAGNTFRFPETAPGQHLCPSRNVLTRHALSVQLPQQSLRSSLKKLIDSYSIADFRWVVNLFLKIITRKLRQYRTKSVWRLCTPSACKFPVIFHKNAREYIKYSLRFLFHLTKNLTTHLSHNLCAVLPEQALTPN